MEVELHSATSFVASSINASALVNTVLGLLCRGTVEHIWAWLALALDGWATILVGVLSKVLVYWAAQELLCW